MRALLIAMFLLVLSSLALADATAAAGACYAIQVRMPVRCAWRAPIRTRGAAIRSPTKGCARSAWRRCGAERLIVIRT